ncbi:methyltransferase [Streptomyces sp. NPDC057702]|uniref:methyltransferase n=1 Tax=unclassified Streptomyces TaxID=2593676 RepID=UPI0036AFA2E6
MPARRCCAPAPGSARDLAQDFGHPLTTRGWHHLKDGVRTGERGFDKECGTDFSGYLATQPELSHQSESAMSQAPRLTATHLADQDDFGDFPHVMDAGGGDGTLLTAVLTRFPELCGSLYATAEGLAQAPDRLAVAGLTERCAPRVGDFIASVPAGADLDPATSVPHDWSGEDCVGILRHCRAALPVLGRMLVVEPLLPSLVDPRIAGRYLGDLNMLVNVGGRERTREDVTELCANAGLAVTSVTALPAPPPSR